VPGLNLAKLKVYQEEQEKEIVRSKSSEELDLRIEKALDQEIKENPDIVDQFANVKELKM